MRIRKYEFDDQVMDGRRKGRSAFDFPVSGIGESELRKNKLMIDICFCYKPTIFKRPCGRECQVRCAAERFFATCVVKLRKTKEIPAWPNRHEAQQGISKI